MMRSSSSAQLGGEHCSRHQPRSCPPPRWVTKKPTLLERWKRRVRSRDGLPKPGTRASVRFADPATSLPVVPQVPRCGCGVCITSTSALAPHAGCGWCGDPATSHCVRSSKASKAVSCASAPDELAPSDWTVRPRGGRGRGSSKNKKSMP